MSARIVINNQGPPVLGSVDEDNSYLGLAHGVSNSDDTGVLGWRWTLVDKPQGSSASLSSSSASSALITPDVAGSYLIRLETFTDAARTVADDVDEQVIGVRFPTPFDWLVPAAGETTQQDARGWAASREEAVRDVHAFMNSGAPSIQGAVNEEITTLGSEVVLGGFVFNGGRVGTLAPSLEGVGVLTVASTGAATLRLYDLGAPGTPAAPVLRAEVDFANGTSGDFIQALQALTVDSAPGVNADEIFDEDRMYELRAIITGANPGDSLKILSAGLRLS